MTRILIVDDDSHIQEALAERFTHQGMDVSTAASGEEAIERLRQERPDVVLLDVQLPRGDGFQVLARIRELGIETTVVMITAYGTVERAVQAMREGAYDFLQKPFEPSLVESVIRRALERSSLLRKDRVQRAQQGPTEEIVCEDPAMKAVLEQARRAAASNATVLLLGESGTGKEVVARLLHRESPRGKEPFVAVNCVALPENLLESELFGHEKGAFTGASARRIGRVELADGGTVFLDEIGDVSGPFQAKLLRLLQERSFERVGGSEPIRADVRFVAATNRDLATAVAEKRFREDLYYRLNVIKLTLPPLRSRPADIVPLARHFLAVYAAEAKRTGMAFAEETVEVLRSYRWPGNVRELKNAVERAVVMAPGAEIQLSDLPPEVLLTTEGQGRTGSYHDQILDFRKAILREALAQCGGNQTQAAERLGIQRTYLARLIKELELNAPDA